MADEPVRALSFDVKGDTSQAEKGLGNLEKIITGLRDSVVSLTSALKYLSGAEKEETKSADEGAQKKKSHLQQLLETIRLRQKEANLVNAAARLSATLARANANEEASERLKAQAMLEYAKTQRNVSQTIYEAERAKRLNVQATLESAKASRMDAQALVENTRAVRMESQANVEIEKTKRLDTQATFENEKAQRLSTQTQLESAKAQKNLEQASLETARAERYHAKAERERAKAAEEATKAQRQSNKETAKTAIEHKKAGDAVKHHSNGLTRLVAALKRILIYRAIRGVIKSVTSALGEGIQRMYEWSKANDQVFMRVMDTYATEVQYLKDALGAALAPLIEMLMPHLVQLVDWFVELINVVNQFFRALAGYDTWLKVEKVAKSYGKEAENAAKAQKALNIQLMDFDQLNNLTTPKSSGKNDDETSPLLGHYTDIDPKIKEAAEKFRKFIEPILADLKVIWGYLMKFVEKLLPLIDLLLAPIMEHIGVIVGGIKYVFEKLDESGALDRFKVAFEKFLINAQPFFDAINEITAKLFVIIGEILPYILDTISLFLPSIGSALGAIGDILLGVFNLAEGLLALLQGDIDGFFAHLGNAIIDLGHGILRLIKSVIMAIFSALEVVLKPFKGFDKWLYEKTGYSLSGKSDIAYSMDEIVSQGAASDEIDKAFEKIIYDIDHIGQEAEKTGDKISDTSYRTATDVLKDFQNTTDRAKERLNTMSSNTRSASSKLVSNIKTELLGLVSSGKISFSKYMELISAIGNGTEEEAKLAINEASRLIKEFTGKAIGYGAVFADDFSRSIKEALKNTRIEVQTGQTQYNRATGSYNTQMRVQAYADGGFPDMGSMFVAGESGAEMVGSINGRTGVVSGDEISGIASAVYGTGAEEAALLRELIGAVRSQRLTISPSASLGKVVNQSTRLYSGVTG